VATSVDLTGRRILVTGASSGIEHCINDVVLRPTANLRP
jgi:NAD(P)-dependent dehydrogenase (short-subunit alcohol dehydrogenase family)